VTVTDSFAQCAYEDDYFLIDRPVNSRYQVEWISEGPSVLYLLDADQELLGEVPNLFAGSEVTTFDLREVVYFQVAGLEEVSYAYSFVFRPITEMPGCSQDDTFEENDQLGDSYPIGAGADLSLVLCPNDEDWFSFRGNPGEIWSLQWSLQEGEPQEVEISVGGDEDFEAGEVLTQITDESELDLIYVVDRTPRHYVRIRCSSCSASQRYQLQLSR